MKALAVILKAGAALALTYACARSLRPTRLDRPKLLDSLCHRRGWTRVRPEIAMACDLDDLLASLCKAKDCTAAARMDVKDAQKDEAKATLNRRQKEQALRDAECDECEAQLLVDKHIAQITASHLEDEPENIVSIE